MNSLKQSAPPNRRSPASGGSVSAEQWWSHHAELLAAKMKVGGVKSFRIELNARGNYEFEVVPTATPNDEKLKNAGPRTPDVRES